MKFCADRDFNCFCRRLISASLRSGYETQGLSLGSTFCTPGTLQPGVVFCYTEPGCPPSDGQYFTQADIMSYDEIFNTPPNTCPNGATTLISGTTTGNSTSPPSPSNQCSSPIPNSCSFYVDCLEDGNYPCGPSGYPLNFGQKYCQSFMAAEPQLSVQGQKWISNTLLCLQTALIPEATGASNAVKGCCALLIKALLSHPACFIQNGFFNLPLHDQFVILWTGNIFGLLNSLPSAIAACEQCVLSCF